MLYTSQYECETAFLVSLPRDEVTASMSLARGVLLISAGKGARAGMERGLPNPRNVRRHPPEQIAKLCRNIETFGFTTALAVDEDRVILVGHGRLEAAARVGLAEVPCFIIEGLASTHARPFRHACLVRDPRRAGALHLGQNDVADPRSSTAMTCR